MPDLRFTDLKVSEAMTKEYGVVDDNTPIRDVFDLILKNRWGEVVLINGNKTFTGLVSKEHLIRTLADGIEDTVSIKAISSNSIITTIEEEDIFKAREVMRRNKIGRMPVIGDEGQVIGLLTARDICNSFTFRLEMAGEQMYTIMQNMAEAIQVIDCQRRVSFWNTAAEKLLGISNEEIMGRNLEEFFPDDLLLKALDNMETFCNVISKLDNGRHIVRNVVPVLFSDGQVIAAVSTSLDITHSVHLIEHLEKAQSKVRKLERMIEAQECKDNDRFYTSNPEMRRILQQAKRVAATDATVLILGESGTGKELLAQMVYKNSQRISQPFIEINCSAIPETLFESEMFGYEAGSFTGADRSGKQGKFEQAKGGTLFLDEIGEVPMEMQAKFLRVLEEQSFYRVGGSTPVQSDVRIIAATNCDLQELVESKRFRSDLYYRLSVVVLQIPPLRERKDDIPGLVQLFTNMLSKEYKRDINGIEQNVMDLLCDYDWPGNVRQLKNLLEGVVILMDDDFISIKSLKNAGALALLNGGGSSAIQHPRMGSIACAHTPLNTMMDNHEAEAIIRTLEACHYNKSKTAVSLGIARTTLYSRMKALGISGRVEDKPNELTYT